MQTYRLIIRRHGRLLGHFDTAAPQSAQAILQIAEHLPAIQGFEHELMVSTEEHRILEVSQGVTRVVSAQPIFKPCKADDTVCRLERA